MFLQMSSWLFNSTDPSIGADRKNEQYWTDVEATYNETTPSHRNLSLNHFWNLLAECMYIDIILSFCHLFVPVKYELSMSFLSYQVWTEHVILILSSENCFLSFLFCIQVSEMAIIIPVLTEMATYFCFCSDSGKDRQLNWHISGLVAHLLLPTGDWTLGQRYIDNWTAIYCSQVSTEQIFRFNRHFYFVKCELIMAFVC